MVYDPKELPIGVFDSGVGGLTVLAALRAALPNESFIYLGDTARLPYGTKSDGTVVRYALQAANVLVDRGIKLLVIACNTASAAGLPALEKEFAPLPTIGVVEPGAQAACKATSAGTIAVIATEATVRGGAYEQAIRRINPDATVVSHACPMFVALAEEGWHQGTIVTAIAQRYLEPLLAPNRCDCLVLGCTHFPVLKGAIASVVGPRIRVVDSASEAAAAVLGALLAGGLQAPAGGRRQMQFLATDGPSRFASIGSGFLGVELRPEDVEVVDL